MATKEETETSGNFFTASEAAKARGVSYASVLNAKDKLAEAGVDISGKGKDWKIPAELLELLPFPRAASSRPAKAGGSRDILAVQEEYAQLELQMNQRELELADLKATAKGLKKELDGLKRNALKTAHAELMEAQARVKAIEGIINSEA